MQLTLSAPDITCEHCIETIRRTAETVPGVRFLSGSWETRQFAVDLASGALLDALDAALAAEGYPLGDVEAPAAAPAAHVNLAGWTPSYRVSATAAGADINYACPCSCDAGFALDRAQAEQPSEHCCCGRTILAGRSAEARLRASLASADAYSFDVQTVTMPWGQPLEVALAIPRDAGHGEHLAD